jgi:DNA-directed RNA polymerase subunit beta'
MAHIELAAPVAHIWFSKGTPSRLGLLMDLSPRNLERVLYFAQHVVISVNSDIRESIKDQERQNYEQNVETAKTNFRKSLSDVSGGPIEEDLLLDNERDLVDRLYLTLDLTEEIKSEVDILLQTLEEELEKLQSEYENKVDELDDLKPLQLITEGRLRDLKGKYGDAFQAGMGAEAVMEFLKNIDLPALRDSLLYEMQTTSGQRRKKAIKRLRVVEAFRKSGNKIGWMLLRVLPVLPPELRPMVQLDGGRFATSDLNDLYRRVINRNNRLRRLMELAAPEIIVRNEKRMLQEAVDALIDNGRRGRPIQGSHNHKLKSLSDLLRGKQGRFRQNLLGKRVDYSGRSVIVVGPELELHQCGIPKRMALELFKPFVMHKLVLLGMAPNIKSAKRMVERAADNVWDILEDVIRERPVLLNRAPTLHRLGIQAFMPVLIEGSAIQLHPLVCTAFNADFDGDQMAVHVPLSQKAVQEAKNTMLSTRNMLSPASGEPLVAPTLDMVLGCYYLTNIRSKAVGTGKTFMSFDQAKLAYDTGHLDLQAEIKVWNSKEDNGWIDTSVGRVLFNEILPPELGFRNHVVNKGVLKDLTGECYRLIGADETAATLDRIKNLGFHYAMKSGITIAINDIRVSPRKKQVIDTATKQIESFASDYMQGLMTEEERYSHAVDTWTNASDQMEEIVKDELNSYGGIAVMAISGAKGNIAQIKQMAGMRGLMSNPKGKIIDLPIKSSFREGLTALEYFISTHGARKGLADTALRTADSGYLTRRLTDVSQDVIILMRDCGTTEGVTLIPTVNEPLLASMEERALGRMSAAPVVNPETGEIILDRSEEINESVLEEMKSFSVTEILVRSPLTCQTPRGLCQLCYGRSPATGHLVKMGEAVGIIAAQSIGEPGTQLTMRTFHTGGVAGIDITSGLPRVEEIFEARIPKGAAVLSDIDGKLEVFEDLEGRRLKITNSEDYREDYLLPEKSNVVVKDGQEIEAGTPMALPRKKQKDSEEQTAEIVANVGGKVKVNGSTISVIWSDVEEREYVVPASAMLLVNDGEEVMAGEALTVGPLNPHDILRVKGKEAVERYMVSEVQRVYRSQGVSIHDRHIEVVTRQMMRRVHVETTGDTDYIPGQIIDIFNFQAKNAKILAEGGEPATARPVLLGVTRSSLLTDSFLAAASFQETTRVLTEASAGGAVDRLRGLKENVIIGRLIPAMTHPDHLAQSEEGLLGSDDLTLDDVELDLLSSGLLGDISGPVPDQVVADDLQNSIIQTDELVVEQDMNEPTSEQLASLESEESE